MAASFALELSKRVHWFDVAFELEALMRQTMANEGSVAGVMDALKSHICIVDPDGGIVAVNQAWRAFAHDNSGASDSDFVGANYLEICHNSEGQDSDEALDVFEGLRAVLRGEQDLFEIEYPCHAPQQKRWFRASISPLWRRPSTLEARNIGAIVSHVDITDRKSAERDFARFSTTDRLTRLPDRRFFNEFAQGEMQSFVRFGQPFSLLLARIDGFEGVSETYGPAAGDEVLRSVASLGKTIFCGDLFARIGREKFVCLLSGSDAPRAVKAAETLRAEIQKLPIVIWSQTIRITASVGVTATIERDRTVDNVLLRAEEALCDATSAGGNRVKSLSLDQPGPVPSSGRRRSEAARSRAIPSAPTRTDQ